MEHARDPRGSRRSGRVAARPRAPAPPADGRRGGPARERRRRRRSSGSRRAGSTASRRPTARSLVDAPLRDRARDRPPRGARARRPADAAAAREPVAPPRRASPRSRRSSSPPSLAVVLARSGSKPKPSAAASAACDAAGAVGDQGRRAERQRRHRLHALGREPGPGALVPRHARRQGLELQLSADGRSTTRRAARRSACGSRSSSTFPVQPLPGGTDPRRLVVIVGPERGPGN